MSNGLCITDSWRKGFSGWLSGSDSCMRQSLNFYTGEGHTPMIKINVQYLYIAMATIVHVYGTGFKLQQRDNVKTPGSTAVRLITWIVCSYRMSQYLVLFWFPWRSAISSSSDFFCFSSLSVASSMVGLPLVCDLNSGVRGFCSSPSYLWGQQQLPIMWLYLTTVYTSYHWENDQVWQVGGVCPKLGKVPGYSPIGGHTCDSSVWGIPLYS